MTIGQIMTRLLKLTRRLFETGKIIIRGIVSVIVVRIRSPRVLKSILIIQTLKIINAVQPITYIFIKNTSKIIFLSS